MSKTYSCSFFLPPPSPFVSEHNECFEFYLWSILSRYDGLCLSPSNDEYNIIRKLGLDFVEYGLFIKRYVYCIFRLRLRWKQAEAVLGNNETRLIDAFLSERAKCMLLCIT